MSAPPKPWELNNIGCDSRVLQSSNIPSSAQFPSIPTQSGRNINVNGPQIVPSRPPRPNTNSFGASPYATTSAYGSSYSPYGYNSMSMYGRPSYGMGYSGYGGMGGMSSYGYGSSYGAPSFGYRDDAESKFIQYAEESSRSTFQNVENIVRAFSSISMMLDNTFFAMTSSFRAVLGVTENFGRLRSMFSHIWMSVNVFRFVNYLYRKLMGMLGFKVPSQNKAWNDAISTNGGQPEPASGSSWPVLAFLGVIVSAPYFISKFLPAGVEDKKDPKTWKQPGIQTKAAYDFTAASEDELSVKTNAMVTVAPQYIQDEMNLARSGWCFCVTPQGSGLIPYNYLKAPMQHLQNPPSQPPALAPDSFT